jgi:caa(3)-type oxidase subunit IV
MAAATPHAAAQPHAHHPGSAMKYIVIWVVLLCLTFTTFGISRLPIGHFHLAAAVFVACIKVFLVAAVFMHLKGSEGTNKLVFAVSFVFVATLLFFVLADIGTRFTLSNSRIRPLPQIDQQILEKQRPPAPEPPAR